MVDIIKAFSRGKGVVIFDDETRENEADIIIPIEKLSPDKVQLMISKARGVLCAALSRDIVQDKGIPLMPSLKNDPHATAFTLSVDSRECSTGVSAYERYITARDLIDPSKKMADFVTPGHLFPLIAKDGGMLQRNGHTEAAVSLCKWANLAEGALICEMIKDDGSMYSRDEAKEFAVSEGLNYCSVEDLINYQRTQFSNVEKLVQSRLTTQFGIFDISVYKELFTDKEHVFLSMGDFTQGPVRIHSECLTGEVFSSLKCDCNNQLHSALELIAREKKGALVYLRQEGRGIGLAEKIKAYKLQQEEGLDTIDANIKLGHKADNRDFHQAAWILKDQGFDSNIQLVTNNPDKMKSLEKHGFAVQPISLKTAVCEDNRDYLKTKKDRMGHNLDI